PGRPGGGTSGRPRARSFLVSGGCAPAGGVVVGNWSTNLGAGNWTGSGSTVCVVRSHTAWSICSRTEYEVQPAKHSKAQASRRHRANLDNIGNLSRTGRASNRVDNIGCNDGDSGEFR